MAIYKEDVFFVCVCVVMISIKESNWTILWAGRAQPNLIKNDQLELAFEITANNNPTTL